MKIDKNNVIILSKGDNDELLVLSKGVVVCLEIITAFSIDGKYIPLDIPVGRMSSEQANELNMVLFGELSHMAYNNPKKLAKLKPKKILKAIRSAHDLLSVFIAMEHLIIVRQVCELTKQYLMKNF